MSVFTTKEEYLLGFEELFGDKNKGSEELELYFNKQINYLDLLLNELTKENFWQIIPKIMGIDSKLVLLTEMIPFEDFSNSSIIRIIENDYPNYYKELCGYNINTEAKHSLIFNVM